MMKVQLKVFTKTLRVMSHRLYQCSISRMGLRLVIVSMTDELLLLLLLLLLYQCNCSFKRTYLLQINCKYVNELQIISYVNVFIYVSKYMPIYILRKPCCRVVRHFTLIMMLSFPETTLDKCY